MPGIYIVVDDSLQNDPDPLKLTVTVTENKVKLRSNLAIRLFESGAAGCRNAEQKLKGVGIL
jgi:hypothetical protein